MEIAQQDPPQPPLAQPELVDPPLQLPLNLENLEAFMHHEIPKDALMNGAELVGPEPHLLGQP